MKFTDGGALEVDDYLSTGRSMISKNIERVRPCGHH